MAAVAGAAKTRRTPVRTCVVCRTSGGKRGLLRVVRLAGEGGVAYDPTGKAAGRGAYVCPTAECVGLAFKRKSLERSLKVALPDTLAHELLAAVPPPSEVEAAMPV